MRRLVLDLQDHLNLNTGAVGQRCHAHCGPGMGAGIAIELAQKVGGAVSHQGLLAEIRGGVDHAQQLVAYLGPADKYFGPLPTRLRSVNQPVIRTRNGFSAPHPTQLACI